MCFSKLWLDYSGKSQAGGRDMLNIFLFAILCLSWGSIWVAIKVGVTAVPPLFFAGTRFIAAGALILLVTAMLRGPRELRVQREDI